MNEVFQSHPEAAIAFETTTRKVPLEKIVPGVLEHGGMISFIATGSSMWPHVRDGDLVTATPIASDRIPKRGWIIIFFSSGGSIAVHRVLGRNQDGTLKVRGDAITGSRERVPPESVLGRIVAIERHGRRVKLTTTVRSLEGRLIAVSGALRIGAERILRSAISAAKSRFAKEP